MPHDFIFQVDSGVLTVCISCITQLAKKYLGIVAKYPKVFVVIGAAVVSYFVLHLLTPLHFLAGVVIATGIAFAFYEFVITPLKNLQAWARRRSGKAELGKVAPKVELKK